MKLRLVFIITATLLAGCEEPITHRIVCNGMGVISSFEFTNASAFPTRSQIELNGVPASFNVCAANDADFVIDGDNTVSIPVLEESVFDFNQSQNQILVEVVSCNGSQVHFSQMVTFTRISRYPNGDNCEEQEVFTAEVSYN